MNRQARRRIERESEKSRNFETGLHFSQDSNFDKQKVEKIATAHVLKEIDSIKEATMRQAVIDLTSTFVLVMYQEHKFGKKRLRKLLEHVNYVFYKVHNGDITVDQIKAECERIGLPYDMFNN